MTDLEVRVLRQFSRQYMQNIARYLSTERVAVVALNFKGHSKSTDHVVWHRKFYCNYISVLHRYPDTATSRSKIAVSVFFRFIFCSVLFSALFTEAGRHTKVSIACLPFYRRLSRGHFDVRAIQAVINSDLIGAFMSCPASHVLHDGMTYRIYRSREERVRCRSICYKWSCLYHDPLPDSYLLHCV